MAEDSVHTFFFPKVQEKQAEFQVAMWTEPIRLSFVKTKNQDGFQGKLLDKNKTQKTFTPGRRKTACVRELRSGKGLEVQFCTTKISRSSSISTVNSSMLLHYSPHQHSSFSISFSLHIFAIFPTVLKLHTLHSSSLSTPSISFSTYGEHSEHQQYTSSPLSQPCPLYLFPSFIIS